MSRGRRYEEPKLNMKKVFAVLLAIVVAVLFNGLYASKERKKSIYFLLALLIPIIIAYYVIMYFDPSLYYTVFGKLEHFTADSSHSAGIRYSSIEGTIQALWQSPIWGWGQEGLKTFFENTWNAIMQNPVVQTIVTTIQTLFQNLVSTLQGIWSGLTQIASGAWELLKNTILAPVLLLIDLVTGNFDQLKSDAQNIWTNIQQAASTIWNYVRRGGSMCELGFFVNNGDTTYNPHLDICNKEIKVVGSWTYQAKDWLQAMEMLKEAMKQGWPVGELVSHKFALDEINEAMETNIRMDGFKIAIVNK